MSHKLRRDETEIARCTVHFTGILRPLRKRRPDQDLGLIGGKPELAYEPQALTEVPDREPRSIEKI